MQRTTTYFGPAEVKNLNITTSRGPTAHVMHCHSAGQTVAPPKLQLTYTYSITAYHRYSLRAHVHTLPFSSANYSL